MRLGWIASVLLLLSSMPGWADLREYDSFALKRSLLQKQIVILDFRIKDCPLCRYRRRGLEEALASPKYKKFEALFVDYDAHRNLRKRYSVSFPGTLVFLWGNQEVLRLAVPMKDPRHKDQEFLKGLLDKALANTEEQEEQLSDQN